MMLSGCDFFRGLAGRPLSSEIEAKREKIELALREKEQRRLDSLARISKIESDRLRSAETLRTFPFPWNSPVFPVYSGLRWNDENRLLRHLSSPPAVHMPQADTAKKADSNM